MGVAGKSLTIEHYSRRHRALQSSAVNEQVTSMKTQGHPRAASGNHYISPRRLFRPGDLHARRLLEQTSPLPEI